MFRSYWRSCAWNTLHVHVMCACACVCVEAGIFSFFLFFFSSKFSRTYSWLAVYYFIIRFQGFVRGRLKRILELNEMKVRIVFFDFRIVDLYSG